jgi:hypothetical protein
MVSAPVGHSAVGTVSPHLLILDEPEISASWRAALRDRLPDDMDAALVMWWAALQPEAEEIRSLVARTPILPVLVRAQLEDDKRSTPKMPGATSRAWEALTRIAITAVRAGSLKPCKGPAKAGELAADKKGQGAIARFLALYIFSSLRMALWRIWRALAFAMTAILLVTLSHLVYPIQPRGLLVSIAATEVLIAVALAVRAMLAIERNSIFNRLTGGTEGRIEWSWPLAGRLAAWVVLPVVGIVATRFPDVGDFVLKLFTPFDMFTR